MSLADIILKSSDMPAVPFPTPEWPEADGKVFLRPFSGIERAAWEQCFHPEDRRTIVVFSNDPRALACGCAMVDEYGTAIFNEGQIAELAKKNAAVLDRAYDAILALSKIRVSLAAAEADRKNS